MNLLRATPWLTTPAVVWLLATVLPGLGTNAAVAAGPERKPPPTNHWAFKPVTRPALPAVKNTGWAHHPIDSFVLAGLEAKGLAPAPPADKPTLLRRVTFDLTGLPPTPAEFAAFAADNSPGAFARVVDRLLASPHYGERWGRHWLDVARFAESQGFEYDKLRPNAWPYRDYVIRSFNDDKPYAQFVQEQIAGDVMEPITREGIAATGFLVAGPYDEAGNGSVSAPLKARIREEELEDMIAVAGQTFLGVTINCARCHDHKFDPIPQVDYYRMKAAFAGVRHGERPMVSRAEAAARDKQAAETRKRVADLERDLAAIEGAARERLAAQSRSPMVGGSAVPGVVMPLPMARWTFNVNANDTIGHMHGTLHGGAEIANGRLKLNGVDAFLRTEPLPRTVREKTLEAWVTLANLSQRGGGAVSLETKDGTFDAMVFGERTPKKWLAGSSNFQRTTDLAAPDEIVQPHEWIHVAVVYRADNSISVYRNGAPYGETYTPAGPNSTLRTYASNECHVLLGLRHTGAGNGFLAGEMDEARLYDRALTAAEIAATARTGPPVATPQAIEAALTSEQRRQRTDLAAELAGHRDELKAFASGPMVFAANPRQPEPTFVLARGDVEKKQEQVTAGGLSAVTTLSPEFGLEATAPEAQRRLRLAAWIASADNPLTARVLVNRVWHHHFGRGIVGTPNDFGVNGERPSHPELLDWLASEFLAQGGSVKKLHRLILLSATYQQAGRYAVNRRRAAPTVDADNRLLWHYPLRRLEAEAARDAMLSVSGRLNFQVGGASFKPFDVVVSGSHFYNLTDSDGPEFNRRTVYRAVVHSGKDPLLDSLDCPDPSTRTPVRGMTTTPIQALGMMNNALVQRQARHFARRLEQEAENDVARQIALGYQLALGRPPSADETARATKSARELGLESVCWALLNSSEFLYIR